MTAPSYIHFSGLNGTVALEGADALKPMISDILAQWPHTHDPSPHAKPFVTLRAQSPHKWSLILDEAPEAPRHWDQVNVICDLIAEMAWERLRSDPALLCLHAAAAEFAGRLVVLPNARRAGKSTLAAALGRLGHRLFTDDVLPITIDAETKMFLGVANGVAPRIRLPLPEDFSDELRTWIDQDPGPFNKQYKYLVNCPIAPGAQMMPLGAIVILDRQNDPCPPSLSELPVEEALSTLISQNFARTLHSGTILKSIDTLAKHLPTFRLSYHNGEDAAAFLSTHEAFQTLPAARHSSANPHNRQAPLQDLGQVAAAFDPSLQYVQVAGVTETGAGEEHFLADGTGLAIYRLNAGSAAIWRLLAEPIALDEAIDVLTMAFDTVDEAQISSDCERLLRALTAANLIVPVESDEVAQ